MRRLLSSSLCANNKFIYFLRTTISITRRSLSFLKVLLLLHLSSFFAIVLDCSVLFVPDGAASAAIWLIKSVIELCDMNNLLLFSRHRNVLSSLPLSPLPRRPIFIFLWHEMCCVCCIQFSSLNFSSSLHKFCLVFSSHRKRNVKKTNRKHKFETFKYASVRALFLSLVYRNYFPLCRPSRVCLPLIPINLFGRKKKHFYQQRMSTQMESKSDTSQITVLCSIHELLMQTSRATSCAWT